MNGTARLTLRSVALCALFVLAVVAASRLAPPATAANSATFADAAGDQGLADAADVTSIAVSNDDNGRITFVVRFSNRSSLQFDDSIQLLLDTDQNPNTGAVGYEYRIRAFGGSASGDQLKLEGWNGSTSTWDENVPQSTFAATFDGAGFTAAINRSELGGTGGFNLYAATLFRGSDGDRAPDSAAVAYSVVIGGGGPPPPQTDTDRDGISDAADACPTVPAGRYDSNHNGCPGPFARIPLATRLPFFVTSGGFTKYPSFAIEKLPAGTSVSIQYRGATEHLTAKKDGKVRSRLLTTRRLRGGATIWIRATKQGWIGYLAKFRVLTTFPGRSLVQLRCIPAVGSRPPAACNRVDRGR